MNERFKAFALAALATLAGACAATHPDEASGTHRPDSGDSQHDAATRTDERPDMTTDETARENTEPGLVRDGGDSLDDNAIDSVAYECASQDDPRVDGAMGWPCAEPNGALELCVADAFSCAPSHYGTVAVASNGSEVALVSISNGGEAIFARFDDELRPLGMVSFPLETGGHVVNWPRLAAHPGGWIFAYEAKDFHVLGLSPSGSRVQKIGKLDNGIAIQLAQRPGGTPLLLMMTTVSVDEARASAVAIADDLSGFSKVSDLGETSVRGGAFVGDGYLAVMESQGADSQTSLQRLALDGTPVGSAVHQGSVLYRFGLVTGDEGTHFFYTAYKPELQQGFVVEVADDGSQLGEPRLLDPALNPEDGGDVLAWESEHVMLQRAIPEARLARIDPAQQVTTLATLTAPTDGIPIGLVRLGDRAVAVVVSQTDSGGDVTLAAVAP